MTLTPVDLTAREATLVLTQVLGPMVAQGAIVRRPRVCAAAERRQSDRRASDVMRLLRHRHGGAPLVLRLGPRRMVLLTTADDVHRVLEGTPSPFSPASREKSGALRHFQPDGVLVSSVPDREQRRPFNEATLDMSEPVHADGQRFAEVVERETTRLLEETFSTGTLDWETFSAAYWRIVRTVVLGERARDDTRLTTLLNALRRDANWSYLHPGRPRLREELDARIRDYVDLAEPGTLAARGRDAGDGVDPAGQIPHWLFAFDAAAMATFRAVAVVASRPTVRARVREELASGTPVAGYARACVLESVRLWPTTMVVLRDSTEPTRWDSRTLEAGTSFVVVSTAFHRDVERLPWADDFRPEVWLDGRADGEWSLVPFSGGPASCPGRNLVLLVSSAVLGRVVDGADLSFARARYLTTDPMPTTVDHAGLELHAERAAAPLATPQRAG
jgi:cytochrome P450